MPIVLTSFTQGTLCHGWAWTIADVDQLALHVAQVALGQSRHVAKILAGANVAPPPTSASMRAAAIDLLTVPAEPIRGIATGGSFRPSLGSRPIAQTPRPSSVRLT